MEAHRVSLHQALTIIPRRNGHLTDNRSFLRLTEPAMPHWIQIMHKFMRLMLSPANSRKSRMDGVRTEIPQFHLTAVSSPIQVMTTNSWGISLPNFMSPTETAPTGVPSQETLMLMSAATPGQKTAAPFSFGLMRKA